MKIFIYLIISIIIVSGAITYLLFKSKPPIEKEIELIQKKPELITPKPEQPLIKKEPKPPIEKEKIEEKIQDTNPYRQAQTIATLELQGGPESIAQLEEILDNPNPSVLIQAVAALGRLQAKDANRKLETLYENSMARPDGYGQSIRMEIIDALGNIKDPSTVDFLGKALNDNQDLMYKDHVLDAYAKIGSKESIPYLEAYVKFIEEHPVKDFRELEFLVDQAKQKTEKIIEEIKNKAEV